MTVKVLRALDGARARRLVAAVRRDPWCLFPAVRAVDPALLVTPYGPPPHAGLDPAGRLLLLEVLPEAATVLPTRLLAERRWLEGRIDAATARLPGARPLAPEARLAAPDFSPPLVEAARSVPALELYRVRPVGGEDGAAVFVEALSRPGAFRPFRPPARAAPAAALQEQAEAWLRRFAPEAEETPAPGGGTIYRYRGETVARLVPRKEGLEVEVPAVGSRVVRTLEQLQQILDRVLARSFLLAAPRGGAAGALRREDILTEAELAEFLAAEEPDSQADGR